MCVSDCASCLQYQNVYSASDIEQALQIFQAHYGHLDIPLAYKIDSSSGDGHLYSGLVSMDGAPLGQLLADIKRRCLHFNKYDLHERWKQALSIYKQHHGSVFPMPRNYRVDSKVQHLYPPHLHGFKLKYNLRQVLDQGNWLKDPYRAQFIELGVIPPEREVRLQFSVTDWYFHLTICFIGPAKQILSDRHRALFPHLQGKTWKPGHRQRLLYSS